MSQEDGRGRPTARMRRGRSRTGAAPAFVHRRLPVATRTSGFGAGDRLPADRSKILVIESDLVTRETLALMLEYYGYDVTAAGSGTEATAMLGDFTPDCVVMDWRPPGLSGICLCLALRRRWPMLPIVVVTSLDEVFDGERPVNAWLPKPIDAPLLHRVIRDELAPVQGA